MSTWRQLVLSLYMSKLFVQVGKEARLHACSMHTVPSVTGTEGTPLPHAHDPHNLAASNMARGQLTAQQLTPVPSLCPSCSASAFLSDLHVDKIGIARLREVYIALATC